MGRRQEPVQSRKADRAKRTDIQMEQSEDLKLIEELAGPVYAAKARDDFMLFVQGLVLPTGNLFCEVMAPFQHDCFEALAPTLVDLRDRYPSSCRRFWIERTKKSGKDADLACVVLWLMAFPTRPFKVQVVAGDYKQATVLRNRVIELLDYNPWLKQLVEVIENKVRNRDGRRQCWTQFEASSTTGGAHGEAPDLLILNEITHAETRWRAIADHLANANGVPYGVVVCVTNAGIKGTNAWVMRKNALTARRTKVNKTARWFVSILGEDGDYPYVRAPWIDEADIAEAKVMDPIGKEYARLWEGRWISGTGGAISDDELDRAFCLQGPIKRAEPGWVYVAGLDLGVSKDHAGMVVLGASREERRIKVVRSKGWAPSLSVGDHLEVPIEDVRAACVQAHRDYNIVWFGYDPAAGGSFFAQDMRRRGIPMKQRNFSGHKEPTLMATSFVQALKEGALQCFDDPEGRLRRDIGKFDIEMLNPTGYRLKAARDETGHADVGTALVICLPVAVDLIGGLWCFDSRSDMTVDGGDLTEEEVEEMPDLLRGIYDMDFREDEREFGREKPYRSLGENPLY